MGGDASGALGGLLALGGCGLPAVLVGKLPDFVCAHACACKSNLWARECLQRGIWSICVLHIVPLPLSSIAESRICPLSSYILEHPGKGDSLSRTLLPLPLLYCSGGGIRLEG